MPRRGCGCCDGVDLSCAEFEILYTPSSQLSRGEHSGVDQSWTANNAYTAGDRFLQNKVQADPLDGIIHKHLWEVPSDRTSGNSWTNGEQNQYTDLGAVDWIDRPEEWHPFGPGWATLDDLERQTAVNSNFLYPGCGYVSIDDVCNAGDWYVAFHDLSTGSQDDTKVFKGFVPPLVAPSVGETMDVRFLGGVVFDIATDTEPQSGNFLRIIDGSGIAGDTCRPTPVDTWVIQREIGYFNAWNSLQVTQRDDYTSNYVFADDNYHYELAVATQPEKATICGGVDLSSGTTEMNGFAIASGRIDSTTSPANYRVTDQNSAFVVTAGGNWKIGFAGATQTANKGDVLRIADMALFETASSGAWVNMATLTDETFLACPVYNLEEVRTPTPTTQGGKVGIYVDSHVDSSNTSGPQTVEFFGARGSRCASVLRPDCEFIKVLDCSCIDIDFNMTGGIDLTADPTPWEHVPPESPTLTPIAGRTIEYETLSTGFDAKDSGLLDANIGRCFGANGKYQAGLGWRVQRERYVVGGTPFAWVFTRLEKLFFLTQNNAMELTGLCGREILAEHRIVLNETGVEGGYDFENNGNNGYASQLAAEQDQLISDATVTTLIAALDKDGLCSLSGVAGMGGRSFKEYDDDNDGDVDRTETRGEFADTADPSDADFWEYYTRKKLFDCSSFATGVTFDSGEPYGGTTVTFNGQ